MVGGGERGGGEEVPCISKVLLSSIQQCWHPSCQGNKRYNLVERPGEQKV